MDLAIRYAELGWHLIPLHSPNGNGCSCGKLDCRSPAKHPMTTNGLKDATISRDKILEWWNKWPSANIGLCTGVNSGVVVLDVDPRHGGNDTLASLESKNGKLPSTVTSRTGGGGTHIYFKHPNVPIKNSVGKLGSGLDLRADGGYVVAPPSRHISGNAYEWESHLSPDETYLADLPQWILELIGNDEQKPSIVKKIQSKITEGRRNNHLTSLAGAMRRKNMGEDGILQALLAENREKCDPPLSDEEIKTIARSVSRYEPATKKTPEKSMFEDLVPWPESVDGLELFQNVKRTLLKYVVMSDKYATACTLWIFFAYGLDYFETNPRLFISGPVKRCGKSTLLSIIGPLVPKRLPTSNASPAAIYRAIEKWHPTLIIDEADSFTKDNDALRGILNSGHTPDQAFALRADGEKLEPKMFSTWAPMAIAGIGHIWDTVEDRSIIIELQRKTASEKVSRLRCGRIFRELEPLRRKLLRWMQDNREDLIQIEPEVPNVLGDRAADNWRPLLKIADILGVTEEATKASIGLSSDRSDDESIKIKLLQDLKIIFGDQSRWHTSDLIGRLAEIESSPWGDWKNGKAISAHALAGLLKSFGIKPKQLYIDEINKNGYELADFETVFVRYLPPETSRDSRKQNGCGLAVNLETLGNNGSRVSESVTTTQNQKVLDLLDIQTGGVGVDDRDASTKQVQEIFAGAKVIS